jgi:hypothetical protein
VSKQHKEEQQHGSANDEIGDAAFHRMEEVDWLDMAGGR